MSQDAAKQLLSLTQKQLDQLPPEVREKIEAVRKQVFAAQRLRTVQTAKDSLLDFVQMSMPDPQHPQDATKSRYQVHKVHEFLAKKLEAVERGEILRLCISVQPRVGKSQLASKSFPAWLMGRDPYRQIILAGYGDEFVKEFGRDVRNLMLSPFYQQVFPGTELNRNAKAANRQQTTAGGILTFAGLGGQLTGKGADFLLVDDPIKNAEEARSKATKDKLWEGFIRDAMSRLMGKAGAVVITATRWAEDDLIGRLTDPELGYTSEEDAAQWEVINIPAFAEEDDPLGRPVGEILWEDRTPRTFLDSFRRLDPAGFAALYMGRPSPPEGNFFKREHIKTYLPHELPHNLRYYAASDHAISTQQNRDSTCMGVVGVDNDDNIWILPDLVWAQLPAEDQVEAMLALMQQHRPLTWWAEKGHISQSIGPFLRKRMLEEQVYCSIVEKTPVKDKQTRAQSIQARMSMGKVRLPAFAPWYADAVEQLLNFPNGAHDDFCVAEGTLICMADGSQKPIESVGMGEYVFTPTGSHQVTDSQRTDAAADVFRVTFDDGTYLVATGNHPVGVGNGEFVRVDRLTQGSLVSCVDQSTQEVTAWPDEELQKQTCGNMKDTVTADTLTASTRTTVDTFMRRSLEGVSYIGTYGKMLMGKSLLASTFTTKTKTPLTTTSPTWNVCPQVSIGRSICENAAKRRSIWHALAGYVHSPQSGISQTKAGSGTAKWSSERGTKENVLKRHASSAVRRLKHLFLTERPTVARNAVTKHGMKRTTNELFQPERSDLAMFAGRSTGTRNVPRGIAALSVGTKSVVAVDRLPEKRPVYNLTVETAHVYYANGTLTHNCDFMAWVGLGLTTQVRAQSMQPRTKTPPSGSLEWILDSANRIRKGNASTERHERYLH